MKTQTCSRPLGCATCGKLKEFKYPKGHKPSHNHSPSEKSGSLTTDSRSQDTPEDKEIERKAKIIPKSSGTHSPQQSGVIQNSADTPEGDSNESLRAKTSGYSQHKSGGTRTAVNGQNPRQTGAGTHSSDNQLLKPTNESQISTHSSDVKDFSKAIDKSGLRGYQFKDNVFCPDCIKLIKKYGGKYRFFCVNCKKKEVRA